MNHLEARLNAFIKQKREDAPKCKPGNKPCGERCIPQAQKCKSEGGGKVAAGIGAAAAIGIGAALLSRSGKAQKGGAQNQPASSSGKALPSGNGKKSLPSGKDSQKTTPEPKKEKKAKEPNFKSDNPYEVLGVDGNASAGEIKEKYKDLANKYHPDKGGNADQMAKINGAYSQAKKFAKKDSLLSRIDSFLVTRIARIDSAYAQIQQDFPNVSSRFWYQ